MVLRISIIIVLIGLNSCSSDKSKEYSKTEGAVEVVSVGEGLYKMYCTRCHGEDGSLGMSGAKDLRASTFTSDQISDRINNGKGAMPAMKDEIGSQEDVDSIVVYVKNLRK